MIAPHIKAEKAVLSTPIEEVYAGIDWISCSLSSGASQVWVWADKCRRVIEAIAEEGYKLEARSLNGYRGLACGGSFWGSRDDGVYVQISSYRADQYFDGLYRDDLSVSRLDVQATVRFRHEDKRIGQQTFNEAVDANRVLSSQRQRKIWYMSAADGGWTTYIGAPSSEQRGYIYNKAVESEKPEYERCWRYECRFRNSFARHWLDKIVFAEQNRPNLCAQIVERYFVARGVSMPWRHLEAPITQPLFNEIPSDADKKLKWLKEQVKPAIRWLVREGYIDGAMAALGFEWEAEEPFPDEGDKLWRYIDA